MQLNDLAPWMLRRPSSLSDQEKQLLCKSSSSGISGMQLYKYSRMWSIWVALSDQTHCHTLYNLYNVAFRCCCCSSRNGNSVSDTCSIQQKGRCIWSKNCCFSNPDHTYPCTSHCSLDGYRKAAAWGWFTSVDAVFCTVNMDQMNECNVRP